MTLLLFLMHRFILKGTAVERYVRVTCTYNEFSWVCVHTSMFFAPTWTTLGWIESLYSIIFSHFGFFKKKLFGKSFRIKCFHACRELLYQKFICVKFFISKLWKKNSSGVLGHKPTVQAQSNTYVAQRPLNMKGKKKAETGLEHAMKRRLHWADLAGSINRPARAGSMGQPIHLPVQAHM